MHFGMKPKKSPYPHTSLGKCLPTFSQILCSVKTPAILLLFI